MARSNLIQQGSLTFLLKWLLCLCSVFIHKDTKRRSHITTRGNPESSCTIVPWLSQLDGASVEGEGNRPGRSPTSLISPPLLPSRRPGWQVEATSKCLYQSCRTRFLASETVPASLTHMLTAYQHSGRDSRKVRRVFTVSKKNTHGTGSTPISCDPTPPAYTV